MKVERKLDYLQNHTNQHYVFEDGKWVFKFIASAIYKIRKFDEVFLSDGTSLGIKEIDCQTDIEYNKEFLIINQMENIIQINWDFELIPMSYCHTMEEIAKVTKYLNQSFEKETFDMIHLEGYKNSKSPYHKSMDKSEISTTGHSRLIFNVVDEVIDIKTYHENYKRAIKKYPMYVNTITHLYKCNAHFLTTSKKYLNV